MKKFIFLLSPFLLTLAACNNSGNKTAATSIDSLKLADSLQDLVIDGHDVAMPKSMRIPNLKREIDRVLDSINHLPAKAQEAAAPYKAKLESVYKDLENASDAMQKWMAEFNFDSAKNDIAKRIKYLTEEKVRVDNVKDAVLGSLAKADSLLKEKF